MGRANRAVSTLSAPQTRMQDQAFVQRCSLAGLRDKLPLRWPVSPDVPASPKKRYRSWYVHPGCDELSELANWAHWSAFDLVLRVVDFNALRPLLAHLLGWTSARGQVPFDPVSLFLFVSWRLVNGWTRSQALRNLRHPRYADYAALFGFREGKWPTEGGLRYFLTTLGQRSDMQAEFVSVAIDETREVAVAVQLLNHLLVASVALLREAGLITPAAWQDALLCPDGQIHDAASRMRCTSVQETCYLSCAERTRVCPAKEKGKRGCDCDTDRCFQVCRYAPVRDPEARCVYYAGTNLRHTLSPNALTDADTAKQERGVLRYGYRSLTLQFAEATRRFSMVLLDDLLPANAREENPSAALLLQLQHFYPDLRVGVVAGDAGLGYYAFLHAIYQLGAKRVVDLRADPSDQDKEQWTARGYDDQGRPVCPFGYAFTANGFDAHRQRHKWFCAQACLSDKHPLVHVKGVQYPPLECPYRDPRRPYGKVVNVAESFADGSVRLARDLPVRTPSWKRLYSRARNASEDRNADLEAWHLKRLPVYGRPRVRALIALADVWINLTTLARLVREATFAAQAPQDI